MSPRKLIALLVYRPPLIRSNVVSNDKATINNIGMEDSSRIKHYISTQSGTAGLHSSVIWCLKSVTQESHGGSCTNYSALELGSGMAT